MEKGREKGTTIPPATGRVPKSKVTSAAALNIDTEYEDILEGSYKLNPDQNKIFDAFTAMLAEFDVHAQVSILEDALNDAQKKTQLDDYYGSCV